MLLSQLLDSPLPIADREITAITCDSRKVGPGVAFVCIRGTARDGHAYAAEAVEKGAAAVITEVPQGLSCEVTVESTRRTWGAMCRRWFGNPAEKLHLIGVTGTNGKTTVTWLLKAALTACGEKVGLIGTIQNMIGERVVPSGHTTPDPYDLQDLLHQMVAEGCNWAVMEVSSHALCQDRVEGLWFDAAIFTNLTQDHLDYHGTMDEYMQAKKRLFAQCDRAIFNIDDSWAEKMMAGLTCPLSTFAVNGAADVTARDIVPRPDGADFTLAAGGESAPLHFAIPGLFSVYNALATAACMLTLGFSLSATAAALAEARGVKGRAEIVPGTGDVTVVIDYAHTPDGLENICRTLKECAAGRLITVFGCGGDRDRTKRPKMGRIAARLSDALVVTSDNPRTEDPMSMIEEILVGVREENTPFLVEENRAAAIRRAITDAHPGDTVLLAGKGHETYQILVSGTIHLDEREIVADVMKDL
ncbi:MAG: UDP-N-acetylmuramoyl-L-alanyl-D-glutamate--2,6-diaminopimelate ligase [Clostridia bacterium]|nr:UDP-N-acetylmuramoyl-L-alanyl-D-glutamate--2,6-diaminopimelate ligase [Clostridia bacterium]